MDQLEIREKLLKIFSQNRLDAINNDLIVSVFFPGTKQADVQAKIEELTKEELYTTIKSQLMSFKEIIEEVLDPQSGIISPEQQLKTILCDVVLVFAISFGYDKEKDSYNHKMQLLFDLIKKQFIEPEGSGKWDKRLYEHFYFVFPILRDWYSFFFSYTNRSAFDINKRFESILSLGNVNNKSNQVARFVADKLIRESLPKGFIDEKELDYGDKFKTEINSAIKTSHTFVQLVSGETFIKEGKTNWCQYEFNQYKDFLSDTKTKHEFYYQNALNNNFFFLVLGPDLPSVRPLILLPEYKNWYREMESTHYAKFYSTDTSGNAGANNFDAFEQIIRKLAKAIIQAKKKLIDSIPPS